jgi:lipopolysaccharide/colanic/teichoic acid biosynthesis glycosyltransferase
VYLLNKFSGAQAVPLVGAYAIKYNVRIRLYLKLLILDALCIASAFTGVGLLTDAQWLSLEGVNLGAMVIPIYVGVAINGNAYSLKSLTHPARAAAETILYLFFTMLAVQCVLYFAHISDTISRVSFAAGIAGSAILLVAVRHPFSRYALKRTDGKLTDELVIQDGVAIDFSAQLTAPTIVDAAANGLYPDLKDPQMLHRLGGWLRTFDRVIVACPAERRHAWTILLQGSSIQGEIILPTSVSSGAIGIGRFLERETHIVSKGPLSMASRTQKRAFDLALTVPALILLSPLLALVVIAIKLESPGPVLFLQDRVGLGNRLFKIAKFRSMRVEATDHMGAASASRTDDRITRVGRLIRKTSIDELPQLFNVLLGDMSIVGPRPHALGSTADAKLFWEVSEYYWCRHALKPGMTGLAQVRGFRGATDKASDLENRLKADLEYLKDWSLAHELSIVLRTFKVLVHKNAF